jgi:hypothetical protein
VQETKDTIQGSILAKSGSQQLSRGLAQIKVWEVGMEGWGPMPPHRIKKRPN